MNQGFRYNLINQISFYAGFIPKLSLSTGESPFINTANSLFIEYHYFMFWRKEISPKREIFPPLAESFLPLEESFPLWGELLPPLGNSFSPKGEMFPPLPESFLPLEESFPLWRELLPPLAELFTPLEKSFPPWRELFPLRRESFPLRQNWWIMHRKSFSTINNGSLLRDSAFVSGYKAIIFIHTLFRRQNRIFPISCGLFRQRGEITKLGKNQVVLI